MTLVIEFRYAEDQANLSSSESSLAAAEALLLKQELARALIGVPSGLRYGAASRDRGGRDAAERFGGLEVDHRVVLGRRLPR